MTDQAETGRGGPEVSARLRLVGVLLLAAYLGLVGWVVLRPVDVGWTTPANLTPFDSVRYAFALGWPEGARQLAGGLLPLAPLGVLLPLAGGRTRARWLPSLLRTAGSTALIATALEILKSWAPGHVLNVDNLMLGTLGAGLVHLAVVPAARARAAALGRRDRTAVPAPAPSPLQTPFPSPFQNPRQNPLQAPRPLRPLETGRRGGLTGAQPLR
ncbi:VanZ family protein [Kitasatospora sp. NPDC051853]|uniref:VanZ family protein n=1 Tax=Kitasatospora sp. NPDC051853 TaxID=3364058 RepID=UPI00378EA866